MHTFFRSSLFLYEVVDTDATPIIIYWRATVFTFDKPRGLEKTLRNILNEFAEGELIEPRDKRSAWEQRQVPQADSKGLGFYWVNISKSEMHKGKIVMQDERMAVWNLSAYEKNNLRLGYSEFLGDAVAYGKDKHAWKNLGLTVKSFWEWLTR